ncbi:MAG: virulence RhuM family protein [Leucobacter sp.]
MIEATSGGDSARKLIRNSTAEFLIFTAQGGAAAIEARYEDETVWLSQKLLAELFDVDVRTVNEHLRSVYASNELNEIATIRKFRIVQREGNRDVAREVKHYNLDAIISVGYRVNSTRATQFRQWATQVLRDFAIRGYVLDRERLENGHYLGEDYFERLLEEIREIRLSERRFYQKVADVYATSIDYNAAASTTKEFFATVQNKLHYAVHGRTAAELIDQRADGEAPHMGLASWKNAPNGKILRSDVTIGKNYLHHDELQDLASLVNAFLELAENRARRRIPMTMQDWARRLDVFLSSDDRELLDGAGSITKQQADRHALDEFEKYRVLQDAQYVSDFDRFSARVLKEGKER